MITHPERKDFILCLACFLLATVLTWWFVICCPLYISDQQMLLSTGIAGGKWLIQILAGLLLLKGKALRFLKEIGFVCFMGSCILIPYILSSMMGWSNDAGFFFGSLVVSVITMIILYYRAVKEMGISLLWWAGWLLCLAVAISLQLTVVFGYI
jgi:hypothetical protein